MKKFVVVVALAMMALTAVFTACAAEEVVVEVEKEVVKEVPVEVVVEKEVPTDPGKLVIYSG